MKTISVKDLSKLVGISEGTLRSWMYKPEIGVVYETGKINHNNVRAKLRNYFGNDFENKFGFKIIDLEIVKAEKSAKRDFVDYFDLVADKEYVLCNYSFESDVLFLKEENEMWFFKKADGKVKVMLKDEISKKNIRFVEK